MTVTPIVVSAIGPVPKGMKKVTDETENEKKNRDH